MNQAARENAQTRIGKQVMLPWSKAFEIALKSIKVRFWRSMITMSSIILAIAFLMSIWTSTAITAGLERGPLRELEAIRTSQALVRDALKGGPDAPTKVQVEERCAAELAQARRRKEALIRDKERAGRRAAGDEAKKLAAEIATLRDELAPEKSLELLRNHLADRRSEVEAVKGALDALLLLERGSQEPAGAEAAPQPSAQAARGGIGAFLDYMSPTDKWLAVLALLVCFVGIANAMFMTVQERFREIGTMKCLGALDAFIVKIFLLESAMLGLIGTLAGMLIGLVLAAARQTLRYGAPTLSYFPWGSILIAAILAAAIGLVLSVLAAIFPAQKAARMEPVAAMRTEE